MTFLGLTSIIGLSIFTSKGSVLVLPRNAEYGIDSLIRLSRKLPKPVEIRIDTNVLEIDSSIELSSLDSNLIISGTKSGTTILGSRSIHSKQVVCSPKSTSKECSSIRQLSINSWADLSPHQIGAATRWRWMLFGERGISFPSRLPANTWEEMQPSHSSISDSQLVQGFFGNEYQDRILPWAFTKRLKTYRIKQIGVQNGMIARGTWTNSQDGVIIHSTGEIRKTELKWIATLNATQNIEFRNITFAQALNGIKVLNSYGIQFRRTKFSDIAGIGLDIVGGERAVVDSSVFHRLGAGGIRIGGGNRSILKPSQHLISNSIIDSFALWNLSYHPAISVWGVGVTIENCKLSNGPHSGIIISGNDHKVSNCTLNSLALETRDVGAIYLGRDLGTRGIVISNNKITHAQGYNGHGGVAIYLDDLTSGVIVDSNEIEKSYIGILVGGGSWNQLRENNIQNTKTPIQHDCRGTNWAKPLAKPGGEWGLLSKLAKTIAGQEDLWRLKYGDLIPPMSDSGFQSVRNQVSYRGKRDIQDPSPPCQPEP